uniref:Uncharacterized protein n=1 Tax=Ditylenchus dipsaci TaxID=166011 RepID=A0A915D4K7_9BILA
MSWAYDNLTPEQQRVIDKDRQELDEKARRFREQNEAERQNQKNMEKNKALGENAIAIEQVLGANCSTEMENFVKVSLDVNITNIADTELPPFCSTYLNYSTCVVNNFENDIAMADQVMRPTRDQGWSDSGYPS